MCNQTWWMYSIRKITMLDLDDWIYFHVLLSIMIMDDECVAGVWVDRRMCVGLNEIPVVGFNLAPSIENLTCWQLSEWFRFGDQQLHHLTQPLFFLSL